MGRLVITSPVQYGPRALEVGAVVDVPDDVTEADAQELLDLGVAEPWTASQGAPVGDSQPAGDDATQKGEAEQEAEGEEEAEQPDEAVLAQLLDLSIPKVVEVLPELSDEALVVLLRLETGGKTRSGLIAAIEAEQEARKAEAEDDTDAAGA